jgi:hypothetical protein
LAFALWVFLLLGEPSTRRRVFELRTRAGGDVWLGAAAFDCLARGVDPFWGLLVSLCQYPVHREGVELFPSAGAQVQEFGEKHLVECSLRRTSRLLCPAHTEDVLGFVHSLVNQNVSRQKTCSNGRRMANTAPLESAMSSCCGNDWDSSNINVVVVMAYESRPTKLMVQSHVCGSSRFWENASKLPSGIAHFQKMH